MRAIAGLSLVAAAALQTSATITEYVIPRPGNFPHDPAVAADGSVWYTDQRNSYIGHLDPETGKIVDYPTPTPGSGPHGLTVAPDGSVWYTGQGDGRARAGGSEDRQDHRVPAARGARGTRTRRSFTRARSGSPTPTTTPTAASTRPPARPRSTPRRRPNSVPYGIVPAPRRLDLDRHAGHQQAGAGGSGHRRRCGSSCCPRRRRGPRRLQVGGDGTVWYTDYGRGYLGALDPATGKVREWRSPSPNAGPYGIAIGTDGRIWYCESRDRHDGGLRPEDGEDGEWCRSPRPAPSSATWRPTAPAGGSGWR